MTRALEVARTPDERFADLPGWSRPSSYVQVEAGDGSGPVRMAYVDAGPADGPTVLLLHGQPTWSFLYRHVIDVLVDGGARVIAPDNIGFGRSDKPVSPYDYTLARHVAWTRSLVAALDLHDVTLVCQDWGGPIGLSALASDPSRYAAVVAANTILHTASPDLAGRLTWAVHGEGESRVVIEEWLLDYLLHTQRAPRLRASEDRVVLVVPARVEAVDGGGSGARRDGRGRVRRRRHGRAGAEELLQGDQVRLLEEGVQGRRQRGGGRRGGGRCRHASGGVDGGRQTGGQGGGRGPRAERLRPPVEVPVEVGRVQLGEHPDLVLGRAEDQHPAGDGHDGDARGLAQRLTVQHLHRRPGAALEPARGDPADQDQQADHDGQREHHAQQQLTHLRLPLPVPLPVRGLSRRRSGRGSRSPGGRSPRRRRPPRRGR